MKGRWSGTVVQTTEATGQSELSASDLIRLDVPLNQAPPFLRPTSVGPDRQTGSHSAILLSSCPGVSAHLWLVFLLSPSDFSAFSQAVSKYSADSSDNLPGTGVFCRALVVSRPQFA